MHAEIWPEVVWVHGRPIVLDGVELKQTILAQSVEDDTITQSAGSLTLTAANLQDRDDSTVGYSGTLPTPPTGAALDFDFTAAMDVDYVALGNFSSSAKVQVSFEYDAGSGFVSWAEFPDKKYTAGNHYFKLNRVNANKIRVKFKDASTGTTISLAHVWRGVGYNFEKSYDIRDSSIGVDTSNIGVTVDVDNAKAFKYCLQSSGTRKDMWEVAWGLRKTWFDDLITHLLYAEIDQKNFLFRDSYRDENFHLVKSRDGNIRANQYQQDYIRVHLRMDEQ